MHSHKQLLNYCSSVFRLLVAMCVRKARLENLTFYISLLWCENRRMAYKMAEASRNASPQRVHRHVVDRVVAFLTVPQQACARRASKALWEAVRAESMEDMLRATVLEQEGPSTVDAQLVVVAMRRAAGPFPSDDALLEWSGGVTLLYEELQHRFPLAAAIGVSARLFAIRPFPFASGSAVTTMCILFALSSTPPTHAVESVVLEVRKTSVLVRALSRDGAACPMLCLQGATPEQFPHMLDGVPLSSLPPIRFIEPSALRLRTSLRSVCLANLPLLESIGDYAFSECVCVSSVDLTQLPSLRSIGQRAFCACSSLQSVSLANLPLLESIGKAAFAGCAQLTSVDLCQLPSLRSIGQDAFYLCSSLQSVNVACLPVLESIGERAFAGCGYFPTVDLSQLPSLRSIGPRAFLGCLSLQSVNLANLPLLESIGKAAFAGCAQLTSVDLSQLPSLRSIGQKAFSGCSSLQSVNFANVSVLESIGKGAFAGCEHLASVDLSQLPSLHSISTQFITSSSRSSSDEL